MLPRLRAPPCGRDRRWEIGLSYCCPPTIIGIEFLISLASPRNSKFLARVNRFSPMYIRVLCRLAKTNKITVHRRNCSSRTEDATRNLAALGDSAIHCKYYTLYWVTLQVYPRISSIQLRAIISSHCVLPHSLYVDVSDRSFWSSFLRSFLRTLRRRIRFRATVCERAWVATSFLEKPWKKPSQHRTRKYVLKCSSDTFRRRFLSIHQDLVQREYRRISLGCTK